MIVEILNQIDTLTQDFIFNGYQNIVSAYEPAIIGLIVLAVIVFGYAVLHGWVEMSLAELGKRVLLVGFVLTFALNWDIFSQYIYKLFTDGPSELVSQLLNSMASSTIKDQASFYTALDKYWDSGMYIATQTLAKGSASNWAPIFIGILMTLLTIILMGITLIELAVAKFGLAIFMVLAPLMVPTMLFRATKNSLFNGWLRYLIIFAFVTVFVICALTVGLLLIAKPISDLESVISAGSIPTLQEISPYILCTLISIGLVIKGSLMASGMAGTAADGASAGVNVLVSKFFNKDVSNNVTNYSSNVSNAARHDGNISNTVIHDSGRGEEGDYSNRPDM